MKKLQKTCRIGVKAASTWWDLPGHDPHWQETDS